MITFTKTGNSVEMDMGNEVFYISTELNVYAKTNLNKIFLQSSPQTKDVVSFISFAPTEVNGRPSDNILAVAEWLRDTYFTGLTLSGGGGGGDATAANQLTEIAELNNIEADLEGFSSKTGSSLVTVAHDYKQIVYSGDNIDYISFKTGGSGGTEVARLTYSYDGSNNITGIAKT